MSLWRLRFYPQPDGISPLLLGILQKKLGCVPLSAKERKLFRLAGRGAWRREAQIVSPEAQLEFIYETRRLNGMSIPFFGQL